MPRKRSDNDDLQTYLDRLVADAPPLTPEQAALLRNVFAGQAAA